MKTTATSGEAATPGALDGFRVLELSSVIMAPHATQVPGDLKSPAGREAFLRILDTCDVFVTNARPGPLARLGLSYQDAAPARPRLIYCQAGVGYTAGEISAMMADGAAEVRAI
jgi:crotonobetainyl-CoA:carnitine CoA-transferase CaiB-like acyl-CoA transferase